MSRACGDEQVVAAPQSMWFGLNPQQQFAALGAEPIRPSPDLNQVSAGVAAPSKRSARSVLHFHERLEVLGIGRVRQFGEQVAGEEDGCSHPGILAATATAGNSDRNWLRQNHARGIGRPPVGEAPTFPKLLRIHRRSRMKSNASDEGNFAFTSLLAVLERHGDNTALVEVRGNDLLTHSYRDLATRAGALARGLLRRDRAGRATRTDGRTARPGSSRVWPSPRRERLVVAIDDLADADETVMNIRTSGLRRLFTVRAHLPMLRDLQRELRVRLILMNDDADGDDRARSWAGLSAREWPPLPPLADDAPAMLVHTSGTTGSPRPFLLTNRNIEVNVNALAGIGLLGPQDRVLLPLPLHHVYPFVVGLLVPFAIGATVVLPEAATGPKIVRAPRTHRCHDDDRRAALYEALVAGMEAQARRAAHGRRGSFQSCCECRSPCGAGSERLRAASCFRRSIAASGVCGCWSRPARSSKNK